MIIILNNKINKVIHYGLIITILVIKPTLILTFHHHNMREIMLVVTIQTIQMVIIIKLIIMIKLKNLLETKLINIMKLMII
jgi:hypothetical protein